jgi:hypothetical protein
VETEDAIDRIYVEVACSWRPPLQATVGEAAASSITVPKSPMTLLCVGAVELGGGGVRSSPAISAAVNVAQNATRYTVGWKNKMKK